MTVKLDFEECLKDSPRFRAEIEVVQSDVSELETRLDKLVKQCQAMVEAGRVYCQSSKSFVNGLRELGHQCSGDAMMEECLHSFSKKLSDILEAQGWTTHLSIPKRPHFANAHNNCPPVPPVLSPRDVRRFKDVRKEFERGSEALEGALVRNAQAPRGKPHEVEEASNALLNARRTFRSEALDYVLEINVIEAKKKTDILMAILSLMEAQAQFFQQGHQSLSELDEYRRKLNEEHTQFVLNSAREKRDMEQRHAAIKKKDISYDDSIMDFNADAVNGIAMEGYLYKRASNAFKTWSRRWFSIQKNQLVYQKKFKDQPTVVVEDLRLCTVKPSAENERRSCFEVVSPSKRTRRGSSKRGSEPYKIALPQPFRSAERTHTARSLGVHFSKVRSLTLDSWEPELVKLMCELGNTVINRIYEARIDEITIKKPHASSPRGDKESWIRSKYVEKKFIQKLPETGRNPPLRRSSGKKARATTQDRTAQRPPLKPKPNRATLPRLTDADEEEEEEDLSGLHPGALLYRSAALQNFPVMADALAHGANVNWVNVAEESSTPLIQAVSANALAACEFLLQNSANVNQADSNGRGADYNARDKNQKDPITIAVDNANADIVTLLRIAKMNKEMREMDGAFGQPGDETYQDIFRDFSHMASNNPEKLKRRSADPKF
ncbi:hypothetical protein F2P81_018367 [Scophthalmus maximus]|uniref:Arf-GAP with coiled-coil, ANK repeat and PH domain-containing protein n=1 Tax=Scophthalmus maximus TaxID=52904 RepID=A0A6A4SFU7_SCOMX|nr:hypothetical protein F2P81_018367 [Scophthalmus maximus]